jgi:hypothetical protein
MVRAGIGGRTIEEAKERMSAAEAADWSEYVARFGSLDLGMRLEYQFAYLMAMVINVFTKQTVKTTDFMPHHEEPELRIEDFMKVLTQSARPGARKQ